MLELHRIVEMLRMMLMSFLANGELFRKAYQLLGLKIWILRPGYWL
jgi:hypothetical protein